MNFPPRPRGPNRSLQNRLADWYPPLILIVAAAFFAQYYMIFAVPYLNLSAYVAGQERMPFQARELMRYPLGWAMHSVALQRLTQGHRGSGTPARLFTEVEAFLGILLSGWAVLKLYRWAEPEAPVPLLPAVMLFVVCMFDYALTVPYGFPYDVPSMAFLGWGLYFLLKDHLIALLVLFPFATWNRETSLFLVFALAAVACCRSGQFTLRLIRRKDVLSLVTMSAIWVAIETLLAHKYAANSTEAGSRIRSNFHALANPVHWPNLLSASAFLLPYVWLRRDRIRQPSLRVCVAILPLWILLLLWKGQILELRIYGDVSVLVAVAAAITVSAAFTQHQVTSSETAAGAARPY